MRYRILLPLICVLVGLSLSASSDAALAGGLAPTFLYQQEDDPEAIAIINRAAEELGWTQRATDRAWVKYTKVIGTCTQFAAHDSIVEGRSLAISELDLAEWEGSSWAQMGYSPYEFHGDTAYFSERLYGEGDFAEQVLIWKIDPYQLMAIHSFECPEQVTVDVLPLAEALYAAALDYGLGTLLSTTEPSAATPFLPSVPSASVSPAPPTPTPGPWDLSVRQMVLIQAIEGGKLVAGKPTALRVYLDWPDPTTVVDAEVALYIDGVHFRTIRQPTSHEYSEYDVLFSRNSANFHIPGHLLTPGTHTFLAHATLTALRNDQMHIEDPDETNNFGVLLDVDFRSMPSLHLLMGSVDRSIGAAEILRFISKARPHLLDIFPVKDVVILDTFPMIRNVIPDMMATQALNLALKRQLYNSQLPPGSPPADYAVGLFPDAHYDVKILGREVGGGSFWWGRRTVLVGAGDRNEFAHEALSHEIGHDFFGSMEEYKIDPSGVGIRIPKVVAIYKGQEAILEDLRAASSTPYVNFMGSYVTRLWVNVETWNLLFDKIAQGWYGAGTVGHLSAPSRRMGERMMEGFIAVGSIGSDRTVRMETLLWLDRVSLADVPQGGSDYWFEYIGRQGETTAGIPVLVDFSVSDPAPFAAIVPAHRDGIARLALTYQGKEIWSLAPSASTPQVRITAPQAATPLSGEIPISWSGSDADGDPLKYYLFYSPDDGASWLPVASDLTAETVSLDSSQLPGCAQCRLRIVANDGWNTASATSETTFSVEDKPPSLLIGHPADGSNVPLGQEIALVASGYDPEDGMLDSQITWYSERDGYLGQGARLLVSTLSEGDHVINAYAYDAASRAAQARLRLHVSGDPSSNSLSLGPLVGLALLSAWSIVGFGFLAVGIVRKTRWMWLAGIFLLAAGCVLVAAVIIMGAV